VNLDERLFRNFFFGEKLCHKLALVSLKLNNIAVLRIFDDAAVAVKLLFAFLKNDLLVDLRIDTLKPFKKQATRVNVSSVTSYTSRECKTKQNKTKRNAAINAPARWSNSSARYAAARECECSCLEPNRRFPSSSFSRLCRRRQSQELRLQKDRSL
jgi:hypothetical protein